MKSKVQYCFVSPREYFDVDPVTGTTYDKYSGRLIADINFIKRKYCLRMTLKGIIRYL